MNEIQIAATLQAMSDSLKAIFNLLDDEKKQHIEFLIKLNNQVSDSQTELKQDFLNFLSKVELQEFALIVKDSQQNIENHQKSILQFNAVIMLYKIIIYCMYHLILCIFTDPRVDDKFNFHFFILLPRQ